MVRVRFAPSPTGFLHIGNARTALFNYLFAKKNNGTFILRIEDTDKERSKPEFINQIYEDLRWLGIEWTEGPDIGGKYGPYLQSDRAALHAEYVAKLMDAGKAYHCYCSEEDLEARRKAQLAAGESPRYDNRCRHLTDAEKRAFGLKGIIPSIRFRMPDSEVLVRDIIRGDVTFDVTLFGDFVIVRPDGTPTFHLAVCVDDGLMGITHVVRGEDHFSNTPRHVAIFEACGFAVPQFAHMPLTMGPGGEPLSKRFGAMSIAEYRKMGYLSEALVNYMALLGWSSGTDQELFTMEELQQKFTLDRVARSAAIFDPVKMNWVAGEHIRKLDDATFAKRGIQFILQDKILDKADFRTRPEWYEKVLLVFKNYISCFKELEDKIALFTDEVSFENEALLCDAEVRAVLTEFAAILQTIEKLDEDTFSKVFKELKKKTKAKGKALFGPVRMAISGQEHGPDLMQILVLLGKNTCLKRVEKALAIGAQAVDSEE